MLRNRGLLHAKAYHDLSHGPFLKGEMVQDVAAGESGDGVEGVGDCGSARHGQTLRRWFAVLSRGGTQSCARTAGLIVAVGSVENSW